MRHWLSRLPHRRAIGLQISDREVVRTRVALTPIGPLVIDRRAAPIGSEGLAGLAEAIKSALGTPEARGRWRQAPVAVGLPPLAVFFGARRGGLEDPLATPAARLGKVMDTNAVAVEELEIDAVPIPTAGRPGWAVAACRRSYLAAILQAMEESGSRPWRVEPSPCAWLRAAAMRAKGPRRAKVVARIFVGQREGLAILETGGFPLAWKSFEIGIEGPSRTVLAQLRMLGALGLQRGLGTPEALLLHGRSAPRDLDESPDWRQATGASPIPIRHFDAPGLEPESIGVGLALGIHEPRPALNLARAVRPPTPALALIPWIQVALQAGLLAGASFVLHDELQQARQRLTTARVERSSHAWIESKTLADLQKERTDLTRRIEALGRFLGDRIGWSLCLDEVASRLPPEMVVKSVEGRSEFTIKKSSKAARSLAIAFEAPIPESVSVPPELGELLDALRAGPVLKRSLPTVEIATLRWSQVGQQRTPMASFTVHCSPGARPPAKPAGSPKKVAMK